MNHPVALRFVGMLACDRALQAAQGCLSTLQPEHPVLDWQVRVDPPQSPCGGAYAVRVQARLASGALVATRADASDVAAAVRDAFDGVAAYLRRVLID
jgi:hypothetical protein